MTEHITPQTAAEILASGSAILIDVREPDEFKAEHIAYAMSVPLAQVGTLFSQMNIPQDKKIIFQCLKGGRAGMACEIISGNTECSQNIYNISGGITAWKDVGLPTVQSKISGTSLSIFRQVQIIVGALIVILILSGLSGAISAFYIAVLIGTALFTAGLTGWCGLAILLSKMPWNK